MLFDRLEGWLMDNVPVTPENVSVGAWVVRNPLWDPEWGDEDIHPNPGARGKVVAWSDAEGGRHGEEPERSSSQLNWNSLVIIHWTAESESEEWKSEQAYRIGFAGEYWISFEASTER